MSHTIRIYNRRLRKAQRYDLNKPIMGEFGIIVNPSTGIPYTFRSYICMGRCSFCRDPNKETRLIRKRKKEQFRFDLKKELNIDEEIEWK